MMGMKRSKRRALDLEIRRWAMEDIQLDPERSKEIMAQVKQRFEQVPNEVPTTRRHHIGHRVIAVAAMAVCFLVFSFAYTVLMPESVSNARGFVRTAAIWVNNTLHLGYEFEVPVDDPATQSTESTVYSTFQEAAANISYPLVYFDNPDFKLISIVLNYWGDIPLITISYSHESELISIDLIPVGEQSHMQLETENQLLTWQNGTLICWESDSRQRASTYYSGMEINITGSNISYSDFESLCRTLLPLNH